MLPTDRLLTAMIIMRMRTNSFYHVFVFLGGFYEETKALPVLSYFTVYDIAV